MSAWSRTWEIFFSALELPPAARGAFVIDACGSDAAMRREVEQLLAAHERQPEFLEHASPLVSQLLSQPGTGEDVAGTQIDRYRIVREIGAGGMGSVYEAEQLAPVRRPVALKLIKLGMDTREVVARFEAERQALALMAHGNIARVFDAGATSDGRPYFVMELVNGVPLTQFCDDERLAVRERLELFIAVCEGVQHAHQKGVIHRDLKPSNVLVAKEGQASVPKIIDFGIAKAIRQPLTDRTVYTQLGSLMGTPAYMSPEQFHPDGADVDTRTDVYALAVLLHELLAGVVPFDDEALRRHGYAEMQRIIRDSEPLRPSTRLQRLDRERTAAIARLRRASARELHRLLAGDLDWIVLKGLGKERDRRYASPGELAEDLRRHLRQQPVLAGPPTATYRARKFVQRHRVGVAITAAVGLLLVGFAVTMAVQSLRLQRALTLVDQQRARAEQVSTFLVDLLREPDPTQARGEDITVREVLDAGARKISTALDRQPEVKARLLLTMGSVYRELGNYERAGTLANDALAITRARPLSDSLLHGSVLNLLGETRHDEGEFEEAEKSYGEALQALEGHGVTAELGGVLSNLMVVTQDRGELAASEAFGRRALDVLTRARGVDPTDLASAQQAFGRTLLQLGRLQEAEPYYRGALALFRRSYPPDDPRLAVSLNHLSSLLNRKGEYLAGVQALQEALTIYRKVLGEDHSYTGSTYANLSRQLHGAGQYEASEKAGAAALAIFERTVGATHPSGVTARQNRAVALLALGRYAQAQGEFEKVLEQDRREFGDEHLNVARTLDWLGITLRSQGQLPQAEALQRRSLAVRRQVLGDEHLEVGIGQRNLAITLAMSGKLAEARPMSDAAVARAQQSAGEKHPTTASALHAAAFIARLAGDLSVADRYVTHAVQVRRESLPGDHPETAESLFELGQVRAAQGRTSEAQVAWNEALQIRSRRLPPEHPDVIASRAALVSR